MVTNKTRKICLSRLLSMVLALCMVLTMLPGQAMAVSSDPTTWPAPDSQYTAPGYSPVYLYLNFSDADGNGFQGNHACGSSYLDQQIVKATSTTAGYVKATCKRCGSWAQIDVPTLTSDALEIADAYKSVMASGVVYDGQPHSVYLKFSDKFQRFFSYKLNEIDFTYTDAGYYPLGIYLQSTVYEYTEMDYPDLFVISPKPVPWNTVFYNQIMDGTSILTGKTAGYTDVNGNHVSVPLNAYQVIRNDEGADLSLPVTNPVAAGIYAVRAEITDKNYIWQRTQGENANIVDTLVWIYPKTSEIYVGDPASSVTLTTDIGGTKTPYKWTLDTTYTGFDSSKPGTTNIRVNATRSDGVLAGQATVPVTVKARPSTTIPAPMINNYTKTYDGKAVALPLPSATTGIKSMSVSYSGTSSKGASYSSTTPPTNAGTYAAKVTFTMDTGYTQLSSVTVSYTIQKAPQTCPKPTLDSSTSSSLTLDAVTNAEYSKDGTTWQASPTFSGLNAGTKYTLYQRLKATSDGNYEASPAVSAQFTTKTNTAQTPTISDYSKTYDGKATALPLPTGTTGVQSMSVKYTGTSSSGTAYSSSTAPVNAGNYTATVSFTMQSGYAQMSDATASYIIRKAAQTCPAPTLDTATTNSLTLNTVTNAEYSKDGTTWQANPTFTGLNAGTKYTLYQRLKATSDGNYEASPAVFGQFTTQNNTVQAPPVNDYSKTYDGKATPLPLPSATAGVKSMSVVYSGTARSASATAPVDAGSYTATVSFTMESGYAQLPDANASYTIRQAPQTCPAPVLADTTTSSLTLEAVTNAEYSKDGTTWQASPVFTGLNAGTSYTLYQRLKATSDGNYEASPAVSGQFSTKNNTAQAPTISDYSKTYDGKATALPLPSAPAGIQSMTVAYSGGTGSNPPVNAGSYTATVSFVMDAGYDQLPDVSVKYNIAKAAQTCPKPTLDTATTSSLTLNTVTNAEYSMDGTSWQASPIFTGLDAGTKYTLYQRLKATSDGNYEASPAVSAEFSTEYLTAEAPKISDYSKAYDGKSTPLPLPALTAGVKSMSVFYKGTTASGTPYTSNKAPVNVGSYTATVSFQMENGYAQLTSATAKYLVGNTGQVCPPPVLEDATTSSLTLEAVENAEYSMDGEVWQDSPTFRNLDPGTTYTLYQRLKASDDGNLEASPAVSGQFTTKYATVDPGDLNLQSQSYPYTGNPIAYQVPTISHVTKTTVTYTVNGTETTSAPVNAGTYPVTVSFTMQAGTAQLEPVNSTLTITKIEQNAPAAPRASSTGTNSITITAIPGAVFSMDGETWQASTLFESLTPDTAYTVRAKYPGDQNHYESPVSSSVIRTTRQNVSAATVQSAVYVYDGTPKSLVADAPLGCTGVTQTFTGTNGTSYGPSTEPPVNPGVYNVKVSYAMQSGYEELQPQYATLTINKATPPMPQAPVVTGVTDSSITIIVEDGNAYSIDGGETWQTTDTFTGLDRDTTYEIKVKVVETPCYKELEGPSTMQATEKTVVTFDRFADQTVEFTGHAQTYTLPKFNPGIASMTITGYDGITTPPTNVGDYVVSIDFVAADGYKLPETLPTPVLHIVHASGNGGMIRPILEDETVTYTGAPQRYHGADGIEGIASAALSYTGADGVETATAPTNAGTYTVTVVFAPDANHILANGSYTATLTIRKAAQNTPMASLVDTSAHSLTVTAIPGAEYSIDGGKSWQNSNIFNGLDAETNYTILVRMAEDENHLPSGTRPVPGRTTDIRVDVSEHGMPDYTTVYNGNRQPYPYTHLAAALEGVKSVSVMYVGTMSSGKPYETSEAPVNAGAYKVRFYLTAAENYDLSEDQLYANMTITKAPQTMDTPPTIARRTTTTITLNPVPGAEYSIDGGETWQDSPKFTGLTPDTTYTFTQRLKETDNYLASESQDVDGKTFADGDLYYEIDYREEIIRFDPDLVEGGRDYGLTDDLPNGGGIIPGTTIYIRLVDDGTGEPGPIVMDTLPERPAAPDVKVNPYDFTMNTTEDMEYSDDGGETWHPCDERQLVEDRQGETLLVRIAATDESFRSDAATVLVPVRGEAPVLTIDNATECMDTTAAMEYSKDNGASWIACLDNMDLSDLTGMTLLVRYACDGVKPASKNASVTVPERNAAPDVTVNNYSELLTATGAHPEYLTENIWTAILAAGLEVSGMTGLELAVRESYDDEHFASVSVLVKVPRRAEKPDLTIDRDKQTVNTAADMEYSMDGGRTWVKCTPDMDVSGMTGQTILVRRGATDDLFASEIVEVRIPNRTENPAVTLDTEKETINTTEDMDYSTDGGKTWNPCTKPLDVSGMTGETVIIRNHGNDNAFPSSGVPIQVPERRDAPKVEVDSKAQTVGSDKGTEFSADGGKTWTKLDKPLHTKDYLGKTILFRFPATKTEFVSRSVTVLISGNPNAPVLIFDTKNETLSTTTGMEYSTDGGKTWKPCPEPLDVSDLDGKDVLVRYPDGESVTVKIPARRKAPNVTVSGNTLTGTDKTMEYRRLPDGKWIAVTGNNVKGLTPGTYEIRYAATSTEMASQVQTVVISKGSANDLDANTSGSRLSLLNRKDHIAYITGRTTTQAAPNASITRAEVATILYRLLTAEAKAAYGTSINRFKDVSADAWYNTAVSTLTNLGVLTGYQDGTFGPQRSITRAELATILARFCETGRDTARDRFTDISGSWARKYINLAAEAGLVNGYTDGTFRPERNITRAEAVAMVNRILGRAVSADTVVNGYKTFSDVPANAWYFWDIVEASNLHSFQKDGAVEKWTALG